MTHSAMFANVCIDEDERSESWTHHGLLVACTVLKFPEAVNLVGLRTNDETMTERRTITPYSSARGKLSGSSRANCAFHIWRATMCKSLAPA